MEPSTAKFFDELSRRGHEPLLARVSATVRFDIRDGEAVDHRMLRIDGGDLRVSSENEPADCTVLVDADLLDGIIAGRTGAMAAFLRGALLLEGDAHVLVLVQRLFPGRPGAPGQAGPEASATAGGAA